MVKKVLVCTIFLSCLSLTAQTDVYKSKIDSLQKILPTIKADTSRVNAFLEISSFYKNLEMAPDAMVYSEKAVELSKKADWKKGLVLSYKSLASSYEYKTDFVNELVYYKKALALAKEIKDDYLIAGVYRNLAVAESNEDPESSFRYFDGAIRIFKKDGHIDEYLEALLQKGGTYTLKGMTYEAADCFREVRDVAEKQGRVNEFMTSSKLLADIYRGRNENKKALEMYLTLLKKAEKQNVYNNYTADVYSAVAFFILMIINIKKP